MHDSTPLPLVQDIIDGLNKAKYFTCLDLYSGYHQILMDEKSKKFTAFITKNGLYQMKKMGQGLRNSGATFTRLMIKVLECPNY